MNRQEVTTWKNKVIYQLHYLNNKFDKKQLQQLKLDVIPRILEKTLPLIKDEKTFNDFKKLIEYSINLIPKDVIDKKTLKSYYQSLNPLKKFVKTNFQLIPLGFNSLRWIFIGVIIGIAYAYFFEVRFGVFIGIAIGFGIGTYFDKKAEKENKVF